MHIFSKSGSLELPPSFIHQNDEDPAWLEALPDLLERLAVRWSLTVAPHFSDIHHNYVAPATRADDTDCVLKLSRHVGETRNEIAALRLWNGDGAARVLDADPDLGALLVERMYPGTMLSQVAETDHFLRLFVAAAKAMKDTANFSGVRFHHFQAIIPRVTLMNNDIEPQLDREIKLLLE